AVRETTLLSSIPADADPGIATGSSSNPSAANRNDQRWLFEILREITWLRSRLAFGTPTVTGHLLTTLMLGTYQMYGMCRTHAQRGTERETPSSWNDLQAAISSPASVKV